LVADRSLFDDGKGSIEKLSAMALAKLAKEGLQVTRAGSKGGKAQGRLKGLLAEYDEIGNLIIAIDAARGRLRAD
jgi:hypothetical protein